MTKTISNILLVIYIILTIGEILIFLDSSKFPQTLLHYNLLGFAILSLIVVIVLYRFITTSLNKAPKEEIRVIYKETEKEKTADDFKDKKDKEKTLSISNAVLEGMESFIGNNAKFADTILTRFSKYFNIVQGYFFTWNNEKQVFSTISTYAYYAEDVAKDYALGEGIVGQVAKNKKFLVMDNVPKGYINVISGLGDGTPNYLAFLPIIKDDKTVAVIEFATFKPLPTPTEKIFDSMSRALSKYSEKFV